MKIDPFLGSFIHYFLSEDSSIISNMKAFNEKSFCIRQSYSNPIFNFIDVLNPESTLYGSWPRNLANGFVDIIDEGNALLFINNYLVSVDSGPTEPFVKLSVAILELQSLTIPIHLTDIIETFNSGIFDDYVRKWYMYISHGDCPVNTIDLTIDYILQDVSLENFLIGSISPGGGLTFSPHSVQPFFGVLANNCNTDRPLLEFFLSICPSTISFEEQDDFSFSIFYTLIISPKMVLQAFDFTPCSNTVQVLIGLNSKTEKGIKLPFPDLNQGAALRASVRAQRTASKILQGSPPRALKPVRGGKSSLPIVNDLSDGSAIISQDSSVSELTHVVKLLSDVLVSVQKSLTPLPILDSSTQLPSQGFSSPTTQLGT
jgi:hypothetical protein